MSHQRSVNEEQRQVKGETLAKCGHKSRQVASKEQAASEGEHQQSRGEGRKTPAECGHKSGQMASGVWAQERAGGQRSVNEEQRRGKEDASGV